MNIPHTLSRLITLEKMKRKQLATHDLASLKRSIALQEQIMAKLQQAKLSLTKNPDHSPSHREEIRQGIAELKREKTVTEDLLSDIHYVCDAFFYTQETSYTQTGNKNRSLWKHYSQTT